MTKVARIFEEEKQQALAKAEKEKRLALAEAEKDKQQALAEAAEKNKLALAREKKDCVLKMLRKNYPSEEIVSIVSGFSLEEIDAMRRELTEAGNP